MTNAILREICGLPTAPFNEGAVMGWIGEFCRGKGLRVRRDKYSNLLVERGDGWPRWVFVAHMDHPGFEAVRMLRDGGIVAKFFGGVRAKNMRGAKVVFFEDEGKGGVMREVRGRIVAAKADRRGYAVGARVKVDGEVTAGACGMFDLPVARRAGRMFHSRAIDDLAGVAAILQAMVNVAEGRGRGSVAALLTRGEEDGFIGAIGAARDGKLLRASDRIVSVECSAMQPYAPQGKGVVIRVGDKTSVFDSASTYQITQVAQRLAKRKKGFAFQRALMPGGTCEATAFDVYGYRAAAVCVPLGNYHNMTPEGKIGAEYIHMGDWQSLVDLLTAMAGEKPAAEMGEVRGGMEKRFAKRAGRLRG